METIWKHMCEYFWDKRKENFLYFLFYFNIARNSYEKYLKKNKALTNVLFCFKNTFVLGQMQTLSYTWYR